MLWQLVLVVECMWICISSPALIPKRRCVFHVRPQFSELAAAGRVSGSVQRCEHTHCCVGYFWILDGRPTVDVQACDVVEKTCPDAVCKAQPRFSNFSKCVCNTDFCNRNMTWSSEPQEPPPTNSWSADAGVKAALMLLLLLMVSLLTAAKWRSFSQHTKDHPPPRTRDSPVQPQCSCRSAPPSDLQYGLIELQQVVGQGHFATVFQGRYKGAAVAVKVFPGGCEERFTAEKEVYELPLLRHDGIAHFLGTGRNPEDHSCFIVLQFAECGSLHSFLDSHSIGWTPAVKMCLSFSQGLSYLHSDLLRSGVHKPPVAHRDLSSCNVLVQADLSCVLCDFGSSTVLRSCIGQRWWQSQTQSMEGRPLLGTLRYMPPEQLEGSVNLSSSCFLMQGDVYALGLVLWEVWMCCSDLFHAVDVPEHLLPYESEVGADAAQETFIQHVVHMNRRPSIPAAWELHAQGSDLKRILRECWDCDADARLSAHCVVERLSCLHSS